MEVDVDDPEMSARLERLFSAFPPASQRDPVDVAYGVRAIEGGWQLECDDGLLRHQFESARLVARLVHGLNKELIERSDLVALHAGGVTRHGVALVLPGEMEVGKTTLTAGLVRAGCGYLSDEAIAIEPDTLHALPYPKPLSIDAGAQDLFPELHDEAEHSDDGSQTQWQVPPDAIRRGAVAEPRPVRLVVFPRYEPDVQERLEPLRRAEALVELAKATFRFNQRPRRSLDLLANTVREAACYRLVVGALDPAVDTLLGMLERSDETEAEPA